jgi:hypothetical protein
MLNATSAAAKRGLVASLLLVLLATVASADDHGNTPETATPIGTDGVPISGNIEPPGDVDYFKFTANAGNLYTIETSNLGPGSDTYLILFAPDGFTILFEDDQGGDEPDASKIVFEATQSDIYYAEVSHFSLEYGTGTYDLSVTDEGGAPPDDHGDTYLTATLVSCGTPVAGDIEVPGDADFFTFVAQVNNFYDAETTNLPEGSDTFLTLFDSDGTSLLLTDDQGGRETNASRIIWRASTIESIDQYYLSVVQFLSNGTGAYQLLVSDMGLPISATPDGTPIQGTLENAGDVDIFAFHAVRGHSYEIALSDGHTGSFRLTLLDTDGMSELQESPFANPFISYAPKVGGTYFVLVREDYTGGDYAFSVTDEGLPPPDPDFDKDGVVGPSDMLIFQQFWHWGTPSPTPSFAPTATPTPGG